MRPRHILFIAIGAVVILAVIIILVGRRPTEPEETQITFWGFEDASHLSGIFSRLKDEKNITVNYLQKSRENFDQQLLEAMASGRTPAIFQLNHHQIWKNQDKITPCPSGTLTLQEYQSRFTDLIFSELVNKQGIWAVPLYLDSLALFYNKDFFNSMAIPQAPTTWEAFKDIVIILTQKDERDNILRAGAAWGTGKNVSYATDLVSALMIQSGTQMLSGDKKLATFNQPVKLDGQSYNAGEKALEFYTDFANLAKEVYTWNRRMPNSLETFAQAKAAMAFGYSQDYWWLKQVAPYLNFGLAPFPQIAQSNIVVNYGNYDVLVVSNRSGRSSVAWQVLEYLTQADNLKTYLTAAKRPAPVRSLINWQKQDLDLGVFAKQVLSVRSWYQPDPQAIAETFIEMIDSVVLKEAEPTQAISRAASKVSQLLR